MTAGQPKVSTRGGAMLPALGLGTWTMGDKKNRWKDEVAALRLGLDLGLNLIPRQLRPIMCAPLPPRVTLSLPRMTSPPSIAPSRRLNPAPGWQCIRAN